MKRGKEKEGEGGRGNKSWYSEVFLLEKCEMML